MTAIIEASFNWIPISIIVLFVGAVLAIWTMIHELRARLKTEESWPELEYKTITSVKILTFVSTIMVLTGSLGSIFSDNNASYSTKESIEKQLNLKNISGPNGGQIRGCYSDMSSYSSSVNWTVEGVESLGVLESFGNSDKTCTYILKTVN